MTKVLRLHYISLPIIVFTFYGYFMVKMIDVCTVVHFFVMKKEKVTKNI